MSHGSLAATRDCGRHLAPPWRSPGGPSRPTKGSGFRRCRCGVMYLDVMAGVAVLLIAVVALSAALVQGMRVSRMAKARTAVLDAAQAEMERLRGVGFDQLGDAAVETPDVMGRVRIYSQGRSKRVVVALQHRQIGSASVTLATEVYRDGMAR